MEKAREVAKGSVKGLVNRKLERFFSVILMLLVSDITVRALGLFGVKQEGVEPFLLIVLTLMWVVVAIMSQLFDEETLLGKILMFFLLPKIEARILEVGTNLIASVLPRQSQPSTDAKKLNSVLDELSELPGTIPYTQTPPGDKPEWIK